MSNGIYGGRAADHTVEDLAEIAIGFLTGNELSPATRDLFVVEGARVADWADEDEQIEHIRDIVRKYLIDPADGRGNVSYLRSPEFMTLAVDWMARSGDEIVYHAAGRDVMLLHPWHRQQLVWCESDEQATEIADALNDQLNTVAAAN